MTEKSKTREQYDLLRNVEMKLDEIQRLLFKLADEVTHRRREVEDELMEEMRPSKQAQAIATNGEE